MSTRYEGSCPRCRVTMNRREGIVTSDPRAVRCPMCGTQFFLRGTG